MFTALAILWIAKTGVQAELIGARDAIRTITSKSPTSVISSAEHAFINRVQAYIVASPKMPPAEAAAKWLELLDAARKVPRRPLHNGGNPAPIGTLSTVVAALPRPEVWPAIEDAVAKRPPTRKNLVLRLLFARLRGDEPAVRKLVADLSKALPGEGELQPYQRFYGDVTYESLLRTGEVEKRLALFTRPNSESSLFNVWMPDVSGLLDQPAASAFLLKLMQNPTQRTNISGASAKKVALEHLSEISTPPWYLASSNADFGFLENLVRHYGLAALCQSSSDSDARSVYFTGLLIRGDLKQAAEMLRRLNKSPGLHFDNSRTRDWTLIGVSPAKLLSELKQLQALFPKIDFWNEYIACARAAGQLAWVVEHYRSVVRNPKTMPDVRGQAMLTLTELEQDQGDIAGTVRDLRIGSSFPTDSYPSWFSSALLRLAKAVRNPAWLSEAVDLERRSNSGNHVWSANMLMDAGALSAAESECLLEMKPGYYSDTSAVQLCKVYWLAGRPKDVLTVIQSYPFWSSDDLGDLLSKVGTYGGSDEPETSLGYFAAWAFAKTGKPDMARKTLRRLLAQQDDLDENYELLGQLGEDGLTSFYDELARADPGQPRPFIWKATVLLHQRKLAEAERVMRQAIALDPTDGNAPAGSRFRAYEVLGRILAAKGDAKGAQECRARLEARNVADRADEMSSFLPQAIELYEKSVRISSADYQTELRLSKCLLKVGRSNEALAHARRAFALLAKDFGPRTELPQDCTELVDADYAVKMGFPHPLKLPGTTPANLCFRARCEENAGFPREAVHDLRLAVERDPTFWNAWTRLSSFGAQGLLPVPELERVAKAHIQLQSEHVYWDVADLSGIADLRPVYAWFQVPPNGRAEPTLLRVHKAQENTDFPVAAPWQVRTKGGFYTAGLAIGQARDVASIISSYGDEFERDGE